ncbi:MAG TPA: 30S ribosomal protein S6 [Dehalococcoidia bacterium]|nr:30S ribosomal protein S6 [Dehalococcoidia bacterium]
MAAKKKQTIEKRETKSQDYELVYIIKPELEEDSIESRIDGVSQFISNNNGTISEVERWGKKKLAYPIKHFLEGSYVLTRFTLSPTHCKELDANLKISEDILRHLLIKVS